MHARAPLDVDLEDKLLYGLTPTRLAYLVLALLATFALWSSPWAPSPARAASCLLVAAVGAAAAWGRWRGRAVDAWSGDISLFVINNYRLALNRSWTRWFKRRPQHASAPSPPVGRRTIAVIGRKPKAGASTVTLELNARPARKGRQAEMWLVRSPANDDPPPSTSYVVVSVVAVEVVASGAAASRALREPAEVIAGEA